MTVKWTQDPNAILDYTLDWRKLLVVGDVLLHANFTPDPGLSVLSQNNTDTLATVWLLNGLVGQTYNVNCHITTAGGRQDDRTFQIVMKEK